MDRLLPKHVFFDWDGTLNDSMPLMYNGVKTVFEHYKKEMPPLEHFVVHCVAPYINYYRDHGVTASEDEIQKLYFASFDYITDSQLFDDVVPVIEKIRGQYSVGIVSAHIEEDIIAMLNRERIRSHFSHVLGGHHDKHHALFNVLQMKHGIPTPYMVYVGDTASDMRDAKNAHVTHRIGITRGNETREHLLAHGATHVIETLHELPRVLECIQNGEEYTGMIIT